MTLPQITKIRRGPGRLNDKQYSSGRPLSHRATAVGA